MWWGVLKTKKRRREEVGRVKDGEGEEGEVEWRVITGR